MSHQPDKAGDERSQAGNELVMIGRYLDPAEAQMAKGMLESEGIEVFLIGANANAMMPLAFRVRLQVMAQDEQAARALLAEVALDAG